ncbi:MAG TPA: SHOCT domain-containing protein, partial [Methylomirabilota bacterium]|nr:SHOCT domain-containing protein [Methylomirabilota bacterium]
MRQVHRDSIGLILAIAIAVNGCAAAVTGGREESGLAQLGKHPEVVAVHYQRPAPFLVAQPRSVGRAIGIAAAVAPFALLLGPLAPSMANLLQADIEKREAEAAGQELMLEIPLEDPAIRVKDRLISGLGADGRIGPIRPAAAAMDSDDLENLKQALGPVTVLDVRTTGWGLIPYQVDPKTFLVHYTVKARLIRLDQEKVLWRDEISCYTPGDRRFGAPALEDLRADGGALLKTTMARTAEVCVDPLLASFRGEQPTRPLPGPDEPARVVLEPATLARAEDTLFGPSGLVEGSRRFKAKFQGLALTAQDLPTLRAMMQRATASPWRSEVQFRGTIGGVAFKAEMEKGSVGRSEFTFEGLRFDDEEQASAFLAPLQGRGVREVKLVGVAGDRPIKIVLTPSAPTWSQPAPSPPPVAANVDEVDRARGLVQEPSPNPSNETVTSPAPASAVSQPAESPNTPVATTDSATPSVESQLQRLDDLRARGVITEDEHAILRKRALQSGRLTPPGPTASLTARPPSRPSVAPGALNWPSVGSSWVLSERTSGSYGTGRRQVTVTYDGEKVWEGKKVRAFSGDTLTTYVDDRRRILARVRSGTVVELFEPYFAFAHW